MRASLCIRTALAAMVTLAQGAVAAPTAHFFEVTYAAQPEAEPAPDDYRNPVLPGFHPDPSIVKVGRDFYLVTSTFGWWPGLPVFHSTDLIHWKLIGHAIDRPGEMNFAGLNVATDGLYAPAISYRAGTFYIFNTCTRCGGNFYVTAKDPAGPWSDPVWLDFEGIDPSLFVDQDGRGWVVNNGAPPEPPRYEGHRAIWLQQFDFASGKLTGPRTVLVDGGVHPEDKPIWAEGPHLYKAGGWYYLMAAEGGTAENHSETIYRSRKVEGPYVAGPVNPILTQRDLPKDRPNRVEATGHADLVHLDDGSWWGIFLATRPFRDQLTLLGRETWLLPVRWEDGWPRFLDPGEAAPFEAKKPALPPSAGTEWAQWTERFDAPVLSGEWLRMRGGGPDQWFALDREHGCLDLVAGADPAGSKGYPSFLGRRLRHPSATLSATFSFAAAHSGDFAGLMAFASEHSFLAVGIERDADGKARVVARRRASERESPYGVPLAEGEALTSSTVEVRISIAEGTADLAWRPAVGGKWRTLTAGIDIAPLASVNSGLFTGVLVGPYAVAGGGG